MKIETKFNIGDEVWFLEHNKVQHAPIIDCYITINSDIGIMEEYTLSFSLIEGCPYRLRSVYLFPTKEELLKSL
jgi:hypothetical protein